MSKIFNISLEELLEVDKVSQEIEEKKEAPETQKVLDTAVAEAEKVDEQKQEEEQAEVETKTNEEEAEVKTEESASEEVTEEEEQTEVESKPVDDQEQNQGEAPDLVGQEEALRENADNDDEIDVATNAAATLESIAYALEQSLETGGLTEDAATITDIALNDIYRCTGIVPKEHEEIAVEDFKSSSKRIKKTKLAIESIGDQVAKIWNAFVAAIRRGIDWLKKFFQEIFNGFVKQQAQVKQLAAAIDAIPNNKIDLSSKSYEEKTSIARLFVEKNANLFINKNINHTSNIVDIGLDKSIRYFHDFVGNFYSLIEKQRRGQVDNFKKFIEAFTESKNIPTFIGSGRIDSSNFIVKKAIKGYLSPSNEVESYSSSESFPGNKAFLAFYPKESAHGDLVDSFQATSGHQPRNSNSPRIAAYNDALSHSSFSIVTEIKETPEIEKIKVLNKLELEKTTKEISNLIEMSLDSKKNFETFISDKKDIEKKLDDLIKSLNKKSGVEKTMDKIGEIAGREVPKGPSMTQIFDPIRNYFFFLKKTYEDGSSKLLALSSQTINASLHYCSYCVRENLNAAKPATPKP